jgi:Uma2 family endonuclease
MNPSITNPQTQKLPPLENGDRLTRAEFERRYAAMPHLKKAELIEGVVYVPAALRFKSHAQPHSNLMGWLWTYQIVTPGVELGDTPTVQLDADNEPQPDAVLLINEQAGGQSRITPEDYVEGAPELVAEVAASSAAYDLYDKKRVYQRNGVQEYMVWQVFEQKIDWFVLDEGRYVFLQPDAEGTLRSLMFPGLWLAVPALVQGDMAEVLKVLQTGLQTPEHQEFVTKLGDRSQ